MATADRFVVYVSVGDEKKLATYAMDPDSGELTPSEMIALGGAPGSLGVDEDQRNLYAALRSNMSIQGLAINSKSGALTSQETIKAVENPVYVIPDINRRYLLTAYYGADKIAFYPINENGTLKAEASQIVATGRNPHSIRMDPSNRFVFVPNTGADTILQFKFDSEKGTVTPNDPPSIRTETGAGPRHFTFHPNGKFVYVVNEKNSSTTAYSFDESKGTLETLQTLPTLPADFTGKNTCADIEITPDGKYLYSSNRGHDSLAGYQIDPTTGRMTSIGHTPTEKTPREFAIDPSGKFVFSCGQASGKMIAYRLDSATGKLNPLKTYDVGKGPAWVLVLRFPDA